jgi:hypothetical protein
LFLLAERRRKVVSAGALIANELKFNAEAITHYESGGSAIQSLQAELATEAWTQHGFESHAYSKAGHKELWTEVASVYDDLRRTKVRGAHPPASAHLMNLAERLAAARY